MFSSGDIIALTAVVGGFLLLFVPIVALVTRKLVRDVASAISDRRLTRELPDSAHAEIADIVRLEERIEELEREIRGLRSDLSFDRQLQPPAAD